MSNDICIKECRKGGTKMFEVEMIKDGEKIRFTADIDELSAKMTDLLKIGYRAEEDICSGAGRRVIPFKLKHFIDFGTKEFYFNHDDHMKTYVKFVIV